MSSSRGNNSGRQNNRRSPFYKGCNNNRTSQSNNKSVKKPEIKKELKFHLRGADKEKETATYGKILEKIFLRI